MYRQNTTTSGNSSLGISSSTASGTFGRRPRHRQRLQLQQSRLQHLVVKSTTSSSSQQEQEPWDSAVPLGQLFQAKLVPTCLWDLALKEDPVPVYASTELGEPDESVVITFNTLHLLTNSQTNNSQLFYLMLFFPVLLPHVPVCGRHHEPVTTSTTSSTCPTTRRHRQQHPRAVPTPSSRLNSFPSSQPSQHHFNF